MARTFLEWTSAANALGYRARSGTAAGEYSSTQELGTVLSAWINLPSGGDYFIAIGSYDSTGGETFGQEVLVHLPSGSIAAVAR